MRWVSHSDWLDWSARELWGSAVFPLELELWVGHELTWLLATWTQVLLLVWWAHSLLSHLLSPSNMKFGIKQLLPEHNAALKHSFQVFSMFTKGFFPYFFFFWQQSKNSELAQVEIQMFQTVGAQGLAEQYEENFRDDVQGSGDLVAIWTGPNQLWNFPENWP